MTSPLLDPRIHAFDSVGHLAEVALQGRLEGHWRFVAPQPAQAWAARVSLRAQPQPGAAQVSEALPGEAMQLLWENAEGWSLARTLHDGYLGWVLSGQVLRTRAPEAGTPVTALRAHAYAGPKVSQPILAELCLGAVVRRTGGEVVVEEGRRWVPVDLPGGQAAYMPEVTLAPLPDDDVAALALRFLDVPYVWGGRSAWGLDCSGLTQTVYAAFGRSLPRDTDQQQAALAAVDTPQRGDLAFFPGHVGLMLDERRMVHANATHMRVTVETLGEGDYGQRLHAALSGFGRWAG